MPSAVSKLFPQTGISRRNSALNAVCVPNSRAQKSKLFVQIVAIHSQTGDIVGGTQSKPDLKGDFMLSLHHQPKFIPNQEFKE
jgi:hypothetical protein